LCYLLAGLYINIFLTCPFGQLTKQDELWANVLIFLEQLKDWVGQVLFYTPAARRGRGVYCPSKIFFVAFFLVGFYTHWTYMHIFCHLFLSNYWWQSAICVKCFGYCLTTLSRPVIINTNRHYDHDIFNRQINIHLEVRHKVIGTVNREILVMVLFWPLNTR
jgi:hypothetical protein